MTRVVARIVDKNGNERELLLKTAQEVMFVIDPSKQWD
jgi:hypothetical protein